MADWKSIAESSKKKLGNFVEENKQQIRYAADTAETWMGAGVMGYIHGRNGGMPKKFGVPVDLGVTGLLKAFAFGGWFGTKAIAADLHAIGNGTGSWFVGTMLLDVGQEKLRNAKDKDGKPVAKGHSLSEAEAKAADIDARANTIIAGGGLDRTLDRLGIGGARGVPMRSRPREVQIESRVY
jgi:hypothetical protein